MEYCAKSELHRVASRDAEGRPNDYDSETSPYHG
jgi:hypothetical protein